MVPTDFGGLGVGSLMMFYPLSLKTLVCLEEETN